MSRYTKPIVLNDDDSAPPAYAAEMGQMAGGAAVLTINEDDGESYRQAEKPVANIYVPSNYPASFAPTHSGTAATFPRGEVFMARARSAEYHVHVEKWTSDAWKIYKKNVGAYCAALLLTGVVTFVFLVVFAISVNAINGPSDNGGNGNGGNDNGGDASANVFLLQHFQHHSSAFTAEAMSSISQVLFERRRDEEDGSKPTDPTQTPIKDKASQHKDNGGAVAFIVISLFMFYFLFVLPMHEGFILASFSALRGNAVTIKDFLVGYAYLGPIAMKGTIMLAAGMVPFVGFLVRIFAWVVTLFFVPLLFNHAEISRRDALRLSYRVTVKNLCGWLFFGAFVIFINFLGMFAFFLGLLVTIPLSCILVAIAYANVFGLDGFVAVQ